MLAVVGRWRKMVGALFVEKKSDRSYLFGNLGAKLSTAAASL